jgi:uncharacterized RDD family membrane protein YckC
MNELDYTNPYEAPAQFTHQARQLHLASRLKRLLGAIIDNIVMLLSIIPGIAVLIGGLVTTDSRGGPDAALPFIFGGIGLMLLGMLVVAVIQIYLLAVSSQSIGKYFLKMQIIDFTTHQPSSFVQCFLLRSLVGIVLLSQVPFYWIIDALFILREDYRCIHDLIGNSIVVDLE